MRPFIRIEQDGALLLRTLFTPHDRKERIVRAAMLRLIRRPLLGRVVGGVFRGGPDLANKEFDVAGV
ncbi:hypothetical protein [Nonomuraea glycinis]|uniref:hypothetical protein n=1 Tax=Nonomuraea glycinis TaxID=2047744 RepID=UPI002E12515F|nr:hypothetical protein OHA68_35040 [Nonomuraea glycinis]